MERGYFNLLKCKATTDLIELFDLKKDVQFYEAATPDGIQYYRVILDSPETKLMKDCIYDLDFYIPQLKIYLQDYIFLQKIPIKEIIMIINRFNVEDIFDPYLHNSKLTKLRKKYFGK